jgi:ATP-dependent helicase/DNAse subunit B
MPAELLLAPVGAGKTEQAVQRILDALDSRDAFQPIWVLLATERQVQAFRARLMEVPQAARVIFNVEFFTFYGLYQCLLDAAGQPFREIESTARLRLLRMLADELIAEGQLPLYSAIANRPGFLRVLSEWINELKSARIEPSSVASVTHSTFHQRQKDTELAALYARYQARLRAHDVVDREGEGWLALALLQDQPFLGRDVRLLVVDGYDQFTPLQAALLAGLSGRIGETLITLTAVPGRENTIGGRFERAKSQLQIAYQQAGFPLTTSTANDTQAHRHPDIQHLAERIFQHNAPLRMADGGVKFIAAPDALSESAAVLRAVKALLLHAQTPPDDVIIALRDYDRYHLHLRVLASEYGLPLVFHRGEVLSQLPPIRALLELLTLHSPHDHLAPFPRRELLTLLRSPYFTVEGLGEREVEQLDSVSRRFAVTGGREAWNEALIEAAHGIRSGEDGDTRERPPLLSLEESHQLQAILNGVFAALTPPPHAPLTDYITWIEGILGQDPTQDSDDDDDPTDPVGYVRMIANLRRPAPESVRSRDLAALEAFKRILRDLLKSQILLAALEDAEDSLSWESFLADLRLAVNTSRLYDDSPSRDGRVLVTSVTDARGLPHAHVFVMGLSEGVFPLRVAEDPLYLDSERRALAAAGLPIQTAGERADDEGLFYELLSLALQTFTLSRPTLLNGTKWIESHLWRATAAIFANADEAIAAGTLGAGELLAIEQAATSDEFALGVAHALWQAQADDTLAAYYNGLLKQMPHRWGNIVSGRTVESARINRVPFNRYNGIIQSPPLLAALQQQFGGSHHWSVSQLNDYGICPFRFFAARALHLEKNQEPTLGMDARHLGSLNHKILEATYQILAAAEITITAPNLPIALETLNQQANHIFAEAPTHFGFRASPLWEQEQRVILTRLQSVIRHDFENMPQELGKLNLPVSARTAYLLEVPFGITGQGSRFTLTDGTQIAVRGYIDRVDRLDDGSVWVMDYKTGSTKIAADELQLGRNLQIMFYLLTVQDILYARRASDPSSPQTVAGGFFWHLGDQATSGRLVAAKADDQQAIADARQRITGMVQAIRAGEFPEQPSKLEDGQCKRYCPFVWLCRIGVSPRQSR